MRKTLFIVLAILISVAFVASADAAAKTKSMKLTGDVVSNDGKQMVVKGPSGEQTFDVSGVKNVDKYKQGDNVTINYKEQDGKMTAAKIKKNTLMKGKPSKETKETAPKEGTEKPSGTAK